MTKATVKLERTSDNRIAGTIFLRDERGRELVPPRRFEAATHNEASYIATRIATEMRIEYRWLESVAKVLVEGPA